MSNDDDDDDDDDGEVAVGMDWDILEDEGTLTDAHPSTQGPFAFHVEGSELVGAGESAASHGVLGEDRWMEEGGPATADPVVMVERSGSGAMPPAVRETSPLPRSRGQARKGPVQTSWGKVLGVRPQSAPDGRRRPRKPLIPLFFHPFTFLF